MSPKHTSANKIRDRRRNRIITEKQSMVIFLQHHCKPTASLDWDLIYVWGNPDSAGLSSYLPLIVNQCHHEWMEPLIPVWYWEGTTCTCKRSYNSKSGGREDGDFQSQGMS